MSWQPIETAPKDRRMLLLYEPSSANGVRDGLILQGRWQPHESYTAGGFWHSPLSAMACVIATAWMPCPEPPK